MAETGLMIVFTVDPRKNPERAALALSIGAAARVSDSKVSRCFAQDGVFAAVKDNIQGLVIPEFAPLEEIMTILREKGRSSTSATRSSGRATCGSGICARACFSRAP